MRAIAIIVILLGIASLVFGVLFVTQAVDAKQEVADSLTPPTTLDTLDATYDNLDQQVSAMQGNEPQYVIMFAQRTSLGLARANVGTAQSVMYSGIVDIVVGAGLVLTGLALAKKSGG